MRINKREMEDILQMYGFTESEGMETTSMYYLVERIKKVRR